MLVLSKTVVKFLLRVIVMLKEFEEMISKKNLKMVKLSFDLLVIQTPNN